MKMYSEVTRTCRAENVSQYNFSEALHVLHISSCINLDQTEFTEYFLLTVDCHQHICRIFAIDNRLSPATPLFLFFNFVISWAILCHCLGGKFGLESED